jgi:hypothetical protein
MRLRFVRLALAVGFAREPRPCRGRSERCCGGKNSGGGERGGGVDGAGPVECRRIRWYLASRLLLAAR